MGSRPAAYGPIWISLKPKRAQMDTIWVTVGKEVPRVGMTLKQKWKWARHTARMKDNRWTKRCTECGNRGERRDKEDDQAEDGKTT